MQTLQSTFSRRLTKMTITALIAAQLVLASGLESSAAVKRIPVSSDQLKGLVQQCLLSGGGNNRNDHNLPVFCCATNSEGAKWCVTCFSGTEKNPNDCSVTTKARITLRNRLMNRIDKADVVAPPVRQTLPRRKLSKPVFGIIAPNN